MYLEYYHLAQKPFQINTDPAFLWFGEKHKEALATLKYGLLEDKSFLLLTGDIGVGKTTIINAFLQDLDKHDLVAVINDPLLNKPDFFSHIAKAFGLAGKLTTKGLFLITFGKFLLDQHYQGKRLLLIVDECQLLNHDLLEEIRLLSNLENNGTKLINIFFIGQLEFIDILLLPENKAIRQRITVNYNILPLSLEETEKYIEHRLTVAGANRKIFNKSAIREIFQFSNGYPRLINVISDRALLTGFITSSKQIQKKIIKECALELDFSLANKANRYGNKKEENQDSKSTGNRHAPLKYIGYAVVICILFVLIYVFFHSSSSFFPADFSKIQTILSEYINKRQKDILPEVSPEPFQISQADRQDIVIPEAPPEPPPADIDLKKASMSIDKTVSTPANRVESPDAERPLDIVVISFASDSLEMSAVSLVELEKFSDAVLRKKNTRITIRGYTDSTGSAQYNKKLAGFRATSVKNILAGKGIPLDTINIASNENRGNDMGQEQDTRRVEVEVEVLNE
ncbi:MAG: AAA family ATPase [Gammaproteobacteria bacterium]|nr:AAA family ATPase [Gammaproteobacteria bacterium]